MAGLVGKCLPKQLEARLCQGYESRVADGLRPSRHLLQLIPLDLTSLVLS